MIDVAVEKYGRIDVMVAAAGLSHAESVSSERNARTTDGLLDQAPEDW